MDYKNGCIYKIINDQTNDIYVGSTCQPLSKRMAKHRSDCKMIPDRPVYKKMTEIGIGHFKIILVEDYPCTKKEELVAREQHWIDLLKPSMNSRNANGINLEKHKISKENGDRKYREMHRESINEYNSEKLSCDTCSKPIRRNHMAKHIRQH